MANGGKKERSWSHENRGWQMHRVSRYKPYTMTAAWCLGYKAQLTLGIIYSSLLPYELSYTLRVSRTRTATCTLGVVLLWIATPLPRVRWFRAKRPFHSVRMTVTDTLERRWCRHARSQTNETAKFDTAINGALLPNEALSLACSFDPTRVHTR